MVKVETTPRSFNIYTFGEKCWVFAHSAFFAVFGFLFRFSVTRRSFTTWGFNRRKVHEAVAATGRAKT